MDYAVPVSPSSLPLRRATSWTGFYSDAMNGAPRDRSEPTLRHSSSFSVLSNAIPPGVRLHEDSPAGGSLTDTVLVETVDQHTAEKQVPAGLVDESSSTDVPEDHAHMASVPEEPVSLSALLDAIRLDVQQSRRARTQRVLLHKTHQAIARNGHLTSLTYQIRMTLVDCIRSEDKDSFATLYKAVKEASSQDPTPSALSEDHGLDWCARLTQGSRSALLAFLAKLRFNPTYLAARISSLSQKQLLALLPGSGKAESVLGQTTSRSTLPLGYAVDQLIDYISANTPVCVLDSIWNVVRTNEDIGQCQGIWANVCARLISEQKPGSEKVVVHLINRFSEAHPQPAYTVLEDWMTDTLDQGRFLLERPRSFRQRIELNHDTRTDEVQRSETFFANAVSSLLEILGHGRLFSQDTLNFSIKILDNLQGSPKHHRAYPAFVVTRWLALSYLPDLLCSPEVYGIMEDHIISELARARILKEICNRAQRIILDILHAWYVCLA